MKFSNTKFEQRIPILPIALVGVILIVLFPCLFILDHFQLIGGKEYPRDILNLFFGLLATSTLLLAGICVSKWPATVTSNNRRPFHKHYKLLPPLGILRDRRNHPNRLAKKPREKLVEIPAKKEIKSSDAVVTFHQWASLPLFPRNGSGKQDSLLDLASNGILLIDNEGMILDTNKTAEKILGRSNKDLQNNPVTNFLPKLFPDAEDKVAFEKFSFQGTESEVFGIFRETFSIGKNGLKKNIKLRMSKQEAYSTLVIAIEILHSLGE
jgi:PAS domain S-box-containing protein